MLITGPITLCGRGDRNDSRTFAGRISNLVVADGALGDGEVWRLWRAGTADGGSEQRQETGGDYGSDAPNVPLQRGGGAATRYDSTLVSGPAQTAAAAASGADGPDTLSAGGAKAAAAAAARWGGATCTAPLPKPWVDPRLITTPLPCRARWGATAGEPCSLDLGRAEGLAFCGEGLLCAPSPKRWQQPRDSDADTTLEGLCAARADGALMPMAHPTPWPTPLAYFP